MFKYLIPFIHKSMFLLYIFWVFSTKSTLLHGQCTFALLDNLSMSCTIPYDHTSDSEEIKNSYFILMKISHMLLTKKGCDVWCPPLIFRDHLYTIIHKVFFILPQSDQPVRGLPWLINQELSLNICTILSPPYQHSLWF